MALTTLGWLGLQNLWLLGALAAQRRGARALLLQAAARGLLLLGLPLLLHVLLLRLHFSMLPRSGNGDSYMSPEFQATLEGSKYAALVAEARRPSFWGQAVEHAQSQFWYNRNMAVLFPRGSHAFDTAWYTWPLAARGIYFSLVADWVGLARQLDAKHTFGFFLHPNPLITLLSTAAAALAALAALGLLAALCAYPLGLRRAGRSAARTAAAASCPGGVGSLLVAYLIHWLPYATQERQTFLLYYLPAYYFAILLTARIWDAVVCRPLPNALAALLTLLLCGATGFVSWQLLPLCFASKVHLGEWTAALRLASTECWSVPGVWEGAPCWVDHV